MIIRSRDALADARSNKLSKWTKAVGSAKERIDQLVCVPGSAQSFANDPSDSIFAIGSCFARNVEERLELAGANVLSRNVQVRNLGVGSARYAGIFNKYNPAAILQELRWAASEEEFPLAGFLPTSDGLFYDAHLRRTSGDSDKETLRKRREDIKRYFSQAFDADLVIITLGLTEAWYDHETGHYVNEIPPPAIIRESDRFGFEVMNYESCLRTLRKVHSLLLSRGRPGLRMIVTVSPVPLIRTFTNQDVIVANMTSKSTLRSAALAFCEETELVDYFPSFEAAMYSEPSIVWEGDRRHVTDFMVGEIIRAFMERYGFAPAAESLAGGYEFFEQSPEQKVIGKFKRETKLLKQRIIELEKEIQNRRALSD
jgi:PAS domain-containing protein